MKETTLTVNKKGTSYGFRRGNNYFTQSDVNYYQKVNAIRGRGVTESDEEKIRAKYPLVEIIFLNDERRIRPHKALRQKIPF
jgi:hypothetical protein